MKIEIVIPQLGESITEAVVAKFIKTSGSYVEEGEELIELETEKVNQPLYAPASGRIQWQVQEGQNVAIGALLGHVDTEAKESQVEKKEVKPEEIKLELPASKKEEAPPVTLTAPRVQKSAFIEQLKEPEPVAAAPIKEKSEAPREMRRQMTKIRKTIAARLVDSLHGSAMLTTFNEVDMSEIIHIRARYKEGFEKKHQVKLGLMSFFIKAVVEALKIYPDFNSYIEGEEIVTRTYYDISVAVSTERGLVVPVVRNCDQLGFAEIESILGALAKKAREGKLTIDDLNGGGFTITNGGVYGSLLSTPILNPPQVGILGMHKILKRPIAVDDEVVVRPMMNLALSYDHRLVDGKEAVSFLIAVKEILEDPMRLLLSL